MSAYPRILVLNENSTFASPLFFNVHFYPSQPKVYGLKLHAMELHASAYYWNMQVSDARYNSAGNCA